MKKVTLLIALLLCVTMVVSAETTKGAGGYFNGKVGLINEASQTSFGPNWAGPGIYNEFALNITADDMGLQGKIKWANIDITDATTVYLDAWYYMFNKALKMDLGYLQTGDYRITTVIDSAGMMPRIMESEQGFLTQLLAVENLSLGLAFVVPVTAQDAATTYQDFRIATSYNIDKVAKIYAGYLNIAKKIFLAADIAAIEKVVLKASYQGDFSGAALSNTVMLTGKVSMDALAVASDIKLDIATAFGASGTVQVTYDVAPYQFGGKVGGSLAASAFTASAGLFATVNAAQGNIKLALDLGNIGGTGNITVAVPITYQVLF